MNIRRFEHDCRRREFRSRQHMLAAAGAWVLVLHVATGAALFLILAVLFFQTAADEARRYRRTGCSLQTRRSIWKGSAPIDRANRSLLGAWRYPWSAQ
jgi:hypothetical protein